MNTVALKLLLLEENPSDIEAHPIDLKKEFSSFCFPYRK